MEPLSSHEHHGDALVLTHVLLRLHVHCPAVLVWRGLAAARNGTRPCVSGGPHLCLAGDIHSSIPRGH